MAGTDWESKSRAELIEEGRSRGWKCTGWSKPQLAEKLRLADEMETLEAEQSLDALEAGEAGVISVSDAIAQTLEEHAGAFAGLAAYDEAGTEQAEESEGSQIEPGEPEEAGSELTDRAASAKPRLSGWCSHVPLWSSSHVRCAAGRSALACECACHGNDFERPPIPEGAQLNRFYA